MVELVHAVVARGDDDIGPGGEDLVSLDLAHFEAAVVILTHGEHPSASAAAEVIAPCWHHLDQLGDRSLCHKTQGMEQTTVSSDVAGIVDETKGFLPTWKICSLKSLLKYSGLAV